ncbi:MAG: hypothetical protein NDJ89_09540 [Oligoflexia bacterium]|nr:hypothetical protein [Oligoflexia bacterium]
MNLPPATDHKWQDIVTGKAKYQFEFLAAKIFLARVGMDIARDSSPANVQNLSNELRDLFEKNAQLGSVKKDLQKIFG